MNSLIESFQNGNAGGFDKRAVSVFIRAVDSRAGVMNVAITVCSTGILSEELKLI